MATDYFLKIIDPEIPGESLQTGHVGEIEMDDWSWGETQAGNAAAGSANAKARVSMQDFRFSKALDVSGPKLQQQCSRGTFIKRAVFTARRTGEGGGAPVDYLTVTFENMVISHYGISGHGEDLHESIAFNFHKVSFSYRQMKDGIAQGTEGKGYDVKASKSYFSETQPATGGGTPAPDSAPVFA